MRSRPFLRYVNTRGEMVILESPHPLGVLSYLADRALSRISRFAFSSNPIARFLRGA